MFCISSPILSDLTIWILFLTIGLLMIIWGSRIRFRIREAQFNRRNENGIEGFNSYKEMRLIRIGENLKHFSSVILRFFGVIFFCIGLFNLWKYF